MILLSTTACNCGGTPATCTTTNCTGCCDSSGECQGGGESLACGSAGASCAVCSSVQQCQLGICRELGAGGGTASGGGAGGGGGGIDAGAPDAGSDAGDDAGLTDAGMSDAGSGDAGMNDAGINDAGMNDAGTADAGFVDAGVRDAGTPDAGRPDAGPPDAGPTHVHILISNTCVVQVQPASLTVPLNSNLRLQFHNHSVDYESDVWSSRGYGYLQLATGGLWADPINHCGGPMPYTEYFDIGIAGGGGSSCPDVRFNIRCQ